MIVAKNLLSGAVFMVTATGASAVTYHPVDVIDADHHLCVSSERTYKANDRRSVNNAINEDADTFYSLGLGGTILELCCAPD